jgi:4-coumarate--CoA ligase
VLTFPGPRDLTIWQWLFDSPGCPTSKYSASEIKGYTNSETEERASYHQIKQYATNLSTALIKKYGFKTGDTVSLFSPNTIWYPVAMLAVNRVGGVVSGASPAYNVEEMAYALQKSDAKFLMTVPGSMEVAAAAAEKAGLKKENVFLLDGQMKGFKTVKELIEEGKKLGEKEQVGAYNIPKGKTNHQVCAFLSFSSGTTGLPKAVSSHPPLDHRVRQTNHCDRS